MTKEQFIEKIAPIVVKYAPKYNINVCSSIIAQACKETGFGTSELALKANNFFGLKFRNNRCPSAKPTPYSKWGSEQNADGTYVNSSMLWFQFDNMEKSVIGYFDFINIPNYANLKGIVDPKIFLETIKKDGYCTSLKYVNECMDLIERYNLTKYDDNNKGSGNKMNYTNSPLVNYTKISPNKTSPRNRAIDTITIHCMAGNLSVETCGNVFAPTLRKASSNYGIGSDGRIAMYVEEKDRSWCSSNADNDNRAITIEVANDGGAPDWHVSDKAMESLIKLCADICKRNNIRELKWSANKNARINHLSGCNMTVHRDFAAKSCPGEYLYERHGYIADEVNKILNGSSSSSQNHSSTTSLGINKFIPSKGNPSQFIEIIKNLKLALNIDYGLQFTINSTIDDILLINLGNVILSTNSYKSNTTYVLQQLLKWWGYGLTIDGIYGTTTKSVISVFQSQTKIKNTGTTTKETWLKLLGK